MPGETIKINTADGKCDGYLALPPGGQGPGVLLLMDAFGIRPYLEEMSESLAGMGYVVFTPNLFYRIGPAPLFALPFPLREKDMAEARAKVIPLARNYDVEAGLRDAEFFLDFLAGHPAVEGRKLGVTGYCMGGAMALRIAGRFPERVGAAACFHGGNLATDSEISPHRLLARAKAEIYIANAEDDPSLPPEQVERLGAALAERALPYTMVTYPAAHGYTMKDLPAYNEAALIRHWQALGQLLARLKAE